MAILILYYSVIIPMNNLKKVLGPDEFKKTLSLPNRYYDRICFDDYLYKEGSMSPLDNERILKKWEEKGLVLTEERHGKIYWKDLCILEMVNDQPLEHPCDWIDIIERQDDEHNLFAQLKGKPIKFPAMPIINS